MRIFLIIYTLAMIAGSVMTLTLVPRSLRDLGKERERLQESMPGASYDRMVEAGYRFNTVVLLVEIAYYYLLLSYGGPEWPLFVGGSFFGVVHIAYLVISRFEKSRLSRDYTRSRASRWMLWATAVLTTLEIVFLVLVLYLLIDTAN